MSVEITPVPQTPPPAPPAETPPVAPRWRAVLNAWPGGGPGLWKIVSNTGWLFADRVLRMGLSLLVFVWVARYLGREQFGTLNYALAFVALFSVLITLGLDEIVIRELVRNPGDKDALLCTTFLLRLIGGALTVGLSIAVIAWLRPRDRVTISLVAIIACGALFQSFDTIDLWFQSQMASKYSALARNGAFLVTSAVRVLLILLHAPLIWFGAAAALELALAASGLLYFLAKTGQGLTVWQPRMRVARELLGQGWPLIFSSVYVMIYHKIDQVMLGQMAGKEEVAIYSAAVRISEVWYFIPMVLASALLPAVVRSRALGTSEYMRRIGRYFDLNASIAYLLAVPLCFCSGLITQLLYGDAYRGAGAILAVHIWASLFVFLGVARNQYLVNEGFFRFAMMATLSGAICNILLNLFWIPRYGGLGAAWATLVSYGLSSWFSSFFYRRTWSIGVRQFEAMIPPLNFIRLLRA